MTVPGRGFPCAWISIVSFCPCAFGLAISAFSALFAFSGPAVAEDRAVRTNREAGELLNIILRRSDRALQPCQVEADWGSRPIPVSIARRYLGLNLHADVIASHTGKRPSEIVDPAGVMKQNFCTREDADKRKDQLLADFKSGVLKIENAPYSTFPRLSVASVRLGMPVFDTTFTTAITSVDYVTRSWTKNSESVKTAPQRYDSDGVNIWPGLDGTGIFYVYRKRKGAWHFVEGDNHYWFH